MSPFRLAALALFVFPFGASAQPPNKPLEPLFWPVPNLPEGAVARVGASSFVLANRHNTIVLSPDGKRIAAGELKVGIYDADTGLPLRQPFPEAGGSMSRKLVWARDDRHLLVIHDDGIRIWDTTTGKQLWHQRLKATNDSWILDARFIAKDKLVAIVHLGPRV